MKVVVCIPDRGDRKDRSLKLIEACIPDRGDGGLLLKLKQRVEERRWLFYNGRVYSLYGVHVFHLISRLGIIGDKWG